jgi:hypothetical protein
MQHETGEGGVSGASRASRPMRLHVPGWAGRRVTPAQMLRVYDVYAGSNAKTVLQACSQRRHASMHVPQ